MQNSTESMTNCENEKNNNISSSLDIKSITSISKNHQAITNFIIHNSPYTQFKFNSVIYSIGDCMKIKDVSNTFSIGKLIRIIPTKGIKSIPFWPSIEVQWFYKKNEIDLSKNGIDQRTYDNISDYELFSSSHKDIILTETVISPCKVLSFEDYQNIEDNTDTIFFTRANYDIKSKLLSPPVSQWEKLCSCRMPLNPDVMYIECDTCKQWFHPQCQGLTDEEAEKLDEFYCDKCKKR